MNELTKEEKRLMSETFDRLVSFLNTIYPGLSKEEARQAVITSVNYTQLLKYQQKLSKKGQNDRH